MENEEALLKQISKMQASLDVIRNDIEDLKSSQLSETFTSKVSRYANDISKIKSENKALSSSIFEINGAIELLSKKIDSNSALQDLELIKKEISKFALLVANQGAYQEELSKRMCSIEEAISKSKGYLKESDFNSRLEDELSNGNATISELKRSLSNLNDSLSIEVKKVSENLDSVKMLKKQFDEKINAIDVGKEVKGIVNIDYINRLYRG